MYCDIASNLLHTSFYLIRSQVRKIVCAYLAYHWPRYKAKASLLLLLPLQSRIVAKKAAFNEAFEQLHKEKGSTMERIADLQTKERDLLEEICRLGGVASDGVHLQAPHIMENPKDII